MHLLNMYQHNSNIDEMKPYRDLFGIENLNYKTSTFVDLECINAANVLQSWINSPGHNKNLLNANVKVTAVYSMIVIKFNKQNIELKAYVTYEADDVESLREKIQSGNHSFVPKRIVKFKK